MKYRIVQLKNGEYIIEKKRRWYEAWNVIAYPRTFSRAKEFINEIMNDIKQDKLKKQGMKIAKIIEEFEV